MKRLLLLSCVLINVVWFNPAISAQKTDNILIFTSFSMPDASLQAWLADADLVGASVVVRGLIDNDWRKTLTKMHHLLGDDPQGGMQIDPVLFQSFNITQVPAVVIVETLLVPCQENMTCNVYGKFDVIYGNVTLRYALTQLQAEGEASGAVVARALAKLEAQEEVIL